MFTLIRLSTEPATPLKIQVAQPVDADAGLTMGGSFYFAPAGEEGDRAGMSEHAARVILGDPGLAPHFRCEPPLPALEVATAPPAPVDAPVTEAPTPDPSVPSREGGRGRR